MGGVGGWLIVTVGLREWWVGCLLLGSWGMSGLFIVGFMGDGWVAHC